MKRLLFVLAHNDVISGEGWKFDPADLEGLREQLLRRLDDPVPVVCLPAGVGLWTVELGEEKAPEPVPVQKGEGEGI